MRFIIFIAILFAFPLTTTAADNSAPAEDIPGMSMPEAAISATDVKQTAPKELTYFCPMHPHIHGEKGSKCPICGMDLVPVNEQSSPEKKGERKILYWYDPMVPGQKFGFSRANAKIIFQIVDIKRPAVNAHGTLRAAF